MKATTVLFVILALLNAMTASAKTLIDFTSGEYSTDDWFEVSDTTRSVGKSFAVIDIQKTQLFQQGVFFSLLNPQPDGACFASRRVNVEWDISNTTTLSIKLRAQGQNDLYSVVLKNDPDTKYSFEYFFNVTVNSGDFETISMPLSGFKAYYRGKVITDVPPLDLSNIRVFGIMVAGGVYTDKKQFGVSSLELKSVSVFGAAIQKCQCRLLTN